MKVSVLNSNFAKTIRFGMDFCQINQYLIKHIESEIKWHCYHIEMEHIAPGSSKFKSVLLNFCFPKPFLHFKTDRINKTKK